METETHETHIHKPSNIIQNMSNNIAYTDNMNTEECAFNMRNQLHGHTHENPHETHTCD